MALLRQVEALFLVNNGGVLVAKVDRGDPAKMDADLMTSMLTAIMNFAKDSFSTDRPRELDYFSLGDRKVELVQGAHAYLAAIYTGTRGSLEKNMKELLAHLEAHYGDALDDVVIQGSDAPIPLLLKRFLGRARFSGEVAEAAPTPSE